MKIARIALAGDAAAPIGDPVLEPPTLRCLGAYWLIRGDDNQNAQIQFDYRKLGADSWKKGPPLFRVERRTTPYLDQGGKPRPPSVVQIPSDGSLFAGSLLLLEPDTEYEMRLRLIDPDGGNAEKLLRSRTIAEPLAPADAIVCHVVPGAGGGSGTSSDPFRGIDAAQKSARPGDLFLLHGGTYAGMIRITHSGEIGKPIIWRGAGDGEATLDGKCPMDHLTGALIDAPGAHDVWFENLSIANAYNLIRAHEAARIVVRRCHLHHALYGVVATQNQSHNLGGFFISDNLMEGIMPWPTTQQQWNDLPESRAVWIGGSGHVVCYNRIHHWKDGTDTADGPICCAIDFHNNEISEMFDDGSEMDGSERNTRNFLNRYTNTLTGVSLQPVYGGPVYVFRNVIYNCQTEAFKLHNSPSGGVLIHNTILKNGAALQLHTNAPVTNCISRNNLYIGTAGRAIDFSPQMIHCDFDYDGFGGFSGPVFIKWNANAYATPAEVHSRAPIERRCVALDPAHLFANGLAAPEDPKKAYDFKLIDPRLSSASQAVDAGEILPGFNDDYHGNAPDLGALEAGTELPHYGPRQ
ncbi:MAG TPA: right-handed parallel beta-helix repeat-containing protein [Humisphaera sp.]|nr:right-handed parallel beta-helix repeat-containing protein [Humisphaera sp.]